MKQKMLSNMEISRICQELAVLIHAGVVLGDGLALLAQEEGGKTGELLAQLGRYVDTGSALTAALRESGLFPSYAIGMIEVGEHTGRTEQALLSLSRYYEQQDQMDHRIRAALTYPSVLLLLMLMVIAVLLIKVLPIFDDVYHCSLHHSIF